MLLEPSQLKLLLVVKHGWSVVLCVIPSLFSFSLCELRYMVVLDACLQL
jgi:hypothetical protein